MNKFYQWFENHIGKKVVVEHPEHGKQTIVVKDKNHAINLQRSQAKSNLNYNTHIVEEDDFVSPVLTNMLVNELLFDSPLGFGGGQTDGGGAGGNWSDDYYNTKDYSAPTVDTTDYSSSTDYSSNDSSSGVVDY